MKATRLIIVLGLSAALPASAQSLWDGGVGDYSTPGNWTPSGVPSNVTPVEINAGTATLTSANWDRRADTLIDGGNLVITNRRVLNAFGGGPATVTIESGSLTHSGEYFIVAQNNVGSVVQNGGSVSSTSIRGFFLSDSNNGVSKGTYTLNGGTLDVTMLNDANTNADMHAHIGRATVGDAIILNGGTATFTGGAADRRFYISHNGLVEVNTGATLNIDAMQYVGIGRRVTETQTAVMSIQGGTVNVTNLQSPSNFFAFVVANGGDGRVEISGGSLTVGNGPMWLGDGGGRKGVFEQSGGTVNLADGEIVLSRNATATGEYLMSGGTLFATDIVAGPGLNPLFEFLAGDIFLDGDKTSVISESWFSGVAGTTAVFNSTLDQTHIYVIPEPVVVSLVGFGALAFGLRRRRG